MSVDHTKNIVEVKNISFAYGQNEVLQDITFEIHQGDYLGLVGPNGSGKTTLIKIILGLLAPKQGSVKLFGQQLADFKDWSRVGYVPQKSFSEVGFPATAEEIALTGVCAKRGLFHRPTPEDRKSVQAVFEQLGLVGCEKKILGELSPGQQQRVFIARALVSRPQIVFLDEPAGGVDRKTQDEFYGLLRRLNREMGLTLVLVSHDIERITQEVMHIACLDKRLVCHASPEEFLQDSRSANILGQTFKVISHHYHN